MNESVLASAVIQRKTLDYLDRKRGDKEFKDFCINSIWFDFLPGIRRSDYYEKVKNRKVGLNGKKNKKYKTKN